MRFTIREALVCRFLADPRSGLGLAFANLITGHFLTGEPQGVLLRIEALTGWSLCISLAATFFCSNLSLRPHQLQQPSKSLVFFIKIGVPVIVAGLDAFEAMAL